jgi:hypothetical protein
MTSSDGIDDRHLPEPLRPHGGGSVLVNEKGLWKLIDELEAYRQKQVHRPTMDIDD